MIRKLLLTVFAGLSLAGCATIERLAIPEVATHDPFWARHTPGSAVTVDHSAWDSFLGKYVSTDAAGVNRMAYANVTHRDRSHLQAYLQRLGGTDTARLSRGEQLAFWINLYNAQTVAVVLDSYPVASIRDIRDGPLSVGPWGRKVITVAGRPLSLHDIEHRILRAGWKDPRIHYVLNCAAVGCPNLARAAYNAANLETAFAQAERDFVNNPRGVRIGQDGRLTLSKIYSWYREDFGGNEPEILRRLARVARPPLRAQLHGRTMVDAYAYDWRLNDRAGAQQAAQQAGR